MERSKNMDRAVIVVVVLLFFGVVYYAGIVTGKRMIPPVEEPKKEEVVEEVYPPPATSVELKVYGELVEKEPPPVPPSPITAPSPVTTPSPEPVSQPVEITSSKTEEKKVIPKQREEQKKEVAKVPSYPKKTVYTVQVASLKKKEDAQKMVTMLRKKGYPVYMVPAMVGGVVYYRVRVGEYRSASEAMKIKEKLEKVEKLKAFVTLKER